MAQETNSETASCRKCGRMLVDEDKFGLCPDCANKVGSPLIAAGASLLLGAAAKFGPKAAKFIFALIKR